MTLKLLSRSELQFINKKALKYDLATAEKDYMLALTLDIINKSRLKDVLVFKGGTAIHHCYLAQSRFSEDLDFTSLDTGLEMNTVEAVFLEFDFYEVKEKYAADKSLKINRLKYSGPLGLPNSLKIEIDKFQNVSMPPVKVPYNNEWIRGIMVNAMDVMEIFAEKVRAASGRARYRDFMIWRFYTGGTSLI